MSLNIPSSLLVKLGPHSARTVHTFLNAVGDIMCGNIEFGVAMHD